VENILDNYNYLLKLIKENPDKFYIELENYYLKELISYEQFRELEEICLVWEIC